MDLAKSIGFRSSCLSGSLARSVEGLELSTLVLIECNAMRAGRVDLTGPKAYNGFGQRAREKHEVEIILPSSTSRKMDLGLISYQTAPMSETSCVVVRTLRLMRLSSRTMGEVIGDFYLKFPCRENPTSRTMPDIGHVTCFGLPAEPIPRWRRDRYHDMIQAATSGSYYHHGQSSTVDVSCANGKQAGIQDRYLELPERQRKALLLEPPTCS